MATFVQLICDGRKKKLKIPESVLGDVEKSLDYIKKSSGKSIIILQGYDAGVNKFVELDEPPPAIEDKDKFEVVVIEQVSLM